MQKRQQRGPGGEPGLHLLTLVLRQSALTFRWFCAVSERRDYVVAWKRQQ
jgi:hypothetical protein